MSFDDTRILEFMSSNVAHPKFSNGLLFSPEWKLGEGFDGRILVDGDKAMLADYLGYTTGPARAQHTVLSEAFLCAPFRTAINLTGGDKLAARGAYVGAIMGVHETGQTAADGGPEYKEIHRFWTARVTPEYIDAVKRTGAVDADLADRLHHLAERGDLFVKRVRDVVAVERRLNNWIEDAQRDMAPAVEDIMNVCMGATLQTELTLANAVGHWPGPPRHGAMIGDAVRYFISTQPAWDYPQVHDVPSERHPVAGSLPDGRLIRTNCRIDEMLLIHNPLPGSQSAAVNQWVTNQLNEPNGWLNTTDRVPTVQSVRLWDATCYFQNLIRDHLQTLAVYIPELRDVLDNGGLEAIHADYVSTTGKDMADVIMATEREAQIYQPSGGQFEEGGYPQYIATPQQSDLLGLPRNANPRFGANRATATANAGFDLL